jgi:hypothetical protein
LYYWKTHQIYMEYNCLSMASGNWFKLTHSFQLQMKENTMELNPAIQTFGQWSWKRQSLKK